jgi:putative CocE/NonD family hydrolase
MMNSTVLKVVGIMGIRTRRTRDRPVGHGRARRGLALGALTGALLAGAAPAAAAPAGSSERFTTSDGVSLQTTLTGEAPLTARPTIVEFSPYGRGSGSLDPGPAFNRLLVQIRGTGDSDGRFDALGPRTQQDVAETLAWACHQTWSTGTLGVSGFSAGAITIYNSLHLRLPCVKAMVLKSGTHELYRDLLSPGGINNIVPGAGVLGLIGAPALAQGPDRLARDPASALDIVQGLVGAGLNDLLHPTLDAWWRERGMRGDVNHLPVLMIDGFFDVESRGAFQAFRALRRPGAHRLVVGAHDGSPAGTDGGLGEARAWFAHHLSGVRNGITHEPRVKLWLADGDREDYLAGHAVRVDGSAWPLPGTRWEPLALDAARGGGGRSLNDGTLTVGAARDARPQSYPVLPSLMTATDQPNTALVGAAGLNALTTALPVLTDMTLAEPLGLAYTTRPLTRDVLTAGPASLELRLSGTAPTTGIWAVISDVGPDGVAHPVGTGRLSTDYPRIDRRRSLRDPRSGDVVQPYGIYDHRSPATPGRFRSYRVELWPIGNRFRAGHRVRLHLLGASLASLPGVPGLATVDTGGSRLLLPVLRGSDLRQALAG